jgi:glycosyltransferase involved in cell wall biosynthesis
MRVLTFGWEFPPVKTGGLGVACQGLTRELCGEGIEILFVLPRSQQTEGSASFRFADIDSNIKVREIESPLVPYQSSGTSFAYYDAVTKQKLFSRSLIEEVHRYAHQASVIAAEEEFDIIHAHDWTSYLAGLSAKAVSGKPLVVHVHATSYDQAAGDNVDPEIFAIEERAFREADRVVTVSQYTKNIIIEKHGANPDKVEVVYNGCDTNETPRHQPALAELKAQGKKIVLYHGRITVQKGVDYFVSAARRVVDVDPDVVFVISGSGDMQGQIMQQVGAMALSRHVIFAGALWDEERDRMYQTADLVVMPSVSEPFGLVPLESMQQDTASLVSKQSGVAEVLTHVLKVDFWDVEEMANKIVAALRYEEMNGQLVREGKQEILKLSWKSAATKVKELYQKLINLGPSGPSTVE